MTDVERDNILLSISEGLSNLNTKVNKNHEEVLQKYEELSERVNKNHEEVLQKYEELSERVNKNYETVIAELERQRKNVARLEDRIVDQIRALFDVREINSDKFKEHEIQLKDIDRTLDWHNRRILKLETSN